MRATTSTGAALAAVALVGWLDYATGPAYGFSLFYLAPIVAIAGRHGRTPAVVVAVTAALAWFVSDLAWRDDVLPSVWNGVTRLAIYVAMGVLVATLRVERAQLRRLLAHERELARTDALTGLMNGRAFLEHASAELARSRRSGAPIALCCLDVDNFKHVNDRFGHAAGDEVLREIAAVLTSSVRAGDRAARLGGDEFALLLADADAGTAGLVASRVITAISTLGARYEGTGLGMSIGISQVQDEVVSVDDLLRRADQAMYKAKASGKQRSVIADGPAVHLRS